MCGKLLKYSCIGKAVSLKKLLRCRKIEIQNIKKIFTDLKEMKLSSVVIDFRRQNKRQNLTERVI